MQYIIHGRECGCTTPATQMVLRQITNDEVFNYKQKGYDLPPNQAVIACPTCGTLVVSWLFLNQSIETARWALKERYRIEEIEEDQ